VPDSTNDLQPLADLGQTTIGTSLILHSLFSVTNKKQSRRSLLRETLKLFGGTLLLSGVEGFRSHSQDIGDETMVIDDALTYGTIMDYRNLLIADNLDKISRTLSFRSQVPFFIGNAHVKGISAYLRNPLLRKKRLLYLPQDLLTKTGVRKYEFNMGDWSLSKTF